MCNGNGLSGCLVRGAKPFERAVYLGGQRLRIKFAQIALCGAAQISFLYCSQRSASQPAGTGNQKVAIR